LLTSAEQIVALENGTKAAESHISKIGRACQPLDAVPRADTRREQSTLIAQLRLLQRSISEASRVLQDSDLLECAQLITIARILSKALIDAKLNSARTLQERVAITRRKLLRLIDWSLASAFTDQSELVTACCAYCLVTGSSSSDALKHVERLRLDKVRGLLSYANAQSSIKEALRYTLDSIAVLKGLAGRPLVDMLGNLLKRPILENLARSSLDTVDSINVRGLLPDEVSSFIPYIKRITFAPKEIGNLLDVWFQEAQTVLLSSLESHLDTESSYVSVLDLRKSLYNILLPVYFSTPDRASFLDKLRAAFNARFATMATDIGQQLVQRFTDRNYDGLGVAKPKSLWQPELAKLYLDKGGQTFLQQVRRRRLGRSQSGVKTAKWIKAWLSHVNALKGDLDALSKHRWRDRLEEPDDEEEDEATDVIHSITHQEPERFQRQLRDSLMSGLSAYERALSDAATLMLTRSAAGEGLVELLRTIRDSLCPLKQFFAGQHDFDQIIAVLPKLHQSLAKEVLRGLSARIEPGQENSLQASSSLEGLPSPQAFQFLHHLCTVMLEVGGTDIWSGPAVSITRQAVAAQVLEGSMRDQIVRTAFDEQYLRAALRVSEEEDTKESNSTDVHAAAQEYWVRTKLLFAILAE
jgi:hypothetical protein